MRLYPPDSPLGESGGQPRTFGVLPGPLASDLAGSDGPPWAFDHAGSQIVWIIRVIGTCLWALCPCAVSTVFRIFPGWSAPVSASLKKHHPSIKLLALRNFNRCISPGLLVLSVETNWEIDNHVNVLYLTNLHDLSDLRTLSNCQAIQRADPRHHQRIAHEISTVLSSGCAASVSV